MADLARPASQPYSEGVPLGHSIAAHRIHGWCYLCADHTLAEEVLAWQVWAYELLPQMLERDRD
ncbi:hypothetical protein [Nonomuraea typhae]|uniref:Uncharacterized protein n=1 Tax=Nonomuraea typhae TaxID=2603600 RepID=A0ABW7YLT7_9ACTN